MRLIGELRRVGCWVYGPQNVSYEIIPFFTERWLLMQHYRVTGNNG